jgi:hypothetical protein
MPIQQLFYINSTSLTTATAVFLDAPLTVCAPDGIYSDGSIKREMIGCVLQPEQPCVDCGITCPIELSVDPSNGFYKMVVSVGSNTGAVIIRFFPEDVPNGIIARYNGIAYNSLSSSYDGLHVGLTNEPIYLGAAASDCGLVAGSPFLLTEYVYDGVVLTPSVTPQLIYISAPQLSLSASTPNLCVMVIPKGLSAVQTVEVDVTSICPTDLFSVDVGCVERLQPIYATIGVLVAVDVCELNTNYIYFSAPVNGDGVTLGLYDWVFYDQYGTNVLADGWYGAAIHCPGTDNVFRIQDGVIVEFDEVCADIDFIWSVESTYSGCDSGDILSTNFKIDWLPIPTSMVDTTSPDNGNFLSPFGSYLITLIVDMDPLLFLCPNLKLEILVDASVVSSGVFSPTNSGTYQVTYTLSALGSVASYNITGKISNA